MTITEVPSSADTPLILVVDDDRSTRTLLKVAMEEEGYRVITAKDGEECLNEYNRCKPNMVLLDAVMPEMDGFTCCKRLHHLSEGEQIPILMITALDDQDSIDQAFASGAIDYITKPIHWAVLAQRVKRLLTTSKALLQLELVQKQLNTSHEWMRFLGTISQRLSHHVVLESFFQDTLDGLCLLAQVQRVSLYQQLGQMRVESATADSFLTEDLSTEVLELQSFYATEFEQGEAIAIEDLSNAPNLPQTAISALLNNQIRSLIILPIVLNEKVWGFLCVFYYQTPHQWKSWEIEQFECLANLLGIAIHNYDFND